MPQQEECTTSVRAPQVTGCIHDCLVNGMNSDEDVSPEEILRFELAKAEEIGKAIASGGRDIAQEGQTLADIAAATYKVLDAAPNVIDTETQISLWKNVNQNETSVLLAVALAKRQMYVSSGTADIAAASIISVLPAPGTLGRFVSPEKQESAQAAIGNFIQVVSRPENKAEVLALLKSLGFDKPWAGQKSPLELCEIAYQAYERPVSDSDPVSTSLIPMRECISAVVAELLRRRPKQEQTKSNYNKVLSIGMQLKQDGISQDTVREWASQWDDLNGELSGAKQGEYTREAWGLRLQEATIFLSGLLKGLDPSKLVR